MILFLIRLFFLYLRVFYFFLAVVTLHRVTGMVRGHVPYATTLTASPFDIPHHSPRRHLQCSLPRLHREGGGPDERVDVHRGPLPQLMDPRPYSVGIQRSDPPPPSLPYPSSSH